MEQLDTHGPLVEAGGFGGGFHSKILAENGR
jgi:hypothetical protein